MIEAGEGQLPEPHQPALPIPMRVNDPLLEGIRHRSCCVKVRYASMQSANAAIAELDARFGDTAAGDPLHAYYCVFCNDFHAGRGAGAEATERVLGDISFMLGFNFRSGCSVCGKVGRFCGASKKAK